MKDRKKISLLLKSEGKAHFCCLKMKIKRLNLPLDNMKKI